MLYSLPAVSLRSKGIPQGGWLTPVTGAGCSGRQCHRDAWRSNHGRRHLLEPLRLEDQEFVSLTVNKIFTNCCQIWLSKYSECTNHHKTIPWVLLSGHAHIFQLTRLVKYKTYHNLRIRKRSQSRSNRSQVTSGSFTRVNHVIMSFTRPQINK